MYIFFKDIKKFEINFDIYHSRAVKTREKMRSFPSLKTDLFFLVYLHMYVICTVIGASSRLNSIQYFILLMVVQF